MKTGAGRSGEKYDLVYVCSLVADVHYTLFEGGVAMNPRYLSICLSIYQSIMVLRGSRAALLSPSPSRMKRVFLAGVREEARNSPRARARGGGLLASRERMWARSYISSRHVLSCYGGFAFGRSLRTAGGVECFA